jgi:enoyl-CoA hydratase
MKTTHQEKKMTDDLVLTANIGAVALLTLNRPDKLNALSPAMLSALANTLELAESDEAVRVIVITGSHRVFAAGADIEVMAEASSQDMLALDTRSYWLQFQAIKKPVLAAVSGWAFGGGCELALQCDLIVASETAEFAQPEVKLGIIPGAGGTQRWAKAVGPYKAMEIVLTGNSINARTALEWNLVNRVVPVERYLDEAMEIAQTIADRPPLAVRLAKEAVKIGVSNSLSQGMDVERRNFLLTFDSHDQLEGMRSFQEKRPPDFKGN